MDFVGIVLGIVGAYLAAGLAFAIPFALVGVAKIDPHAAHGSWGFRVLIIPGTVFLWPLLARRWAKGIHEPPEEHNAHRCAARRSADLQSAVSQACSLHRIGDKSGALENSGAQPTASRRHGRLETCATAAPNAGQQTAHSVPLTSSRPSPLPKGAEREKEASP